MKPPYRQLKPNQRGALGDTSPPQAQSLTDLLGQLETLELRLQHLKTGIANLIQLRQTEADLPSEERQQATQELAVLQAAADSFELDLASRVISWQHLQEPFWQAVRFGGLGIVVGWALAWLVYGR